MTREYYIQLRREGRVDMKHMFDFYEQADHHLEKIGWMDFQKIFPHYLAKGHTVEGYIKYYDNHYELMFLTIGDKKEIV